MTSYTHVTNLVMNPHKSDIDVQAFSWFLNSSLQRSIAILLTILDTFTTLHISRKWILKNAINRISVIHKL